MPSLSDGAVIFVLALLLFGPKKLPELARQLGKLMAEFRRASNEFRLQMEEELRVSEQADRQKKLAELEAAKPAPTPLDIPEPEHPHMLSTEQFAAESMPEHQIHFPGEDPGGNPAENLAEPTPIASSGDLHLMPPSTGLPIPRSNSLAPLLESIPHTPDPSVQEHEKEASLHG